MKKIAIITARGGSKRIPQKNIKEFCGKPLISFSIKAAISSGLFDRVLVSTDSDEIRKVAIEHGAEVPFFRSSASSSDFATTAEVVLEVIEELKKNQEEYEFLCCIYPTAPMISSEKLEKSFNLLQKHNAFSVVPVAKFSYPIQRAMILDKNELRLREEKYKNTRSQDLEETYHDSGQFYWVRTEIFLKEKTFFTSKCFPMILPEIEVQDIDTLEDFKLAELKYELFFDKNKHKEVDRI
jgi:pseudaminic acid cytidylyltransferase